MWCFWSTQIGTPIGYPSWYPAYSIEPPNPILFKFTEIKFLCRITEMWLNSKITFLNLIKLPKWSLVSWFSLHWWSTNSSFQKYSASVHIRKQLFELLSVSEIMLANFLLSHTLFIYSLLTQFSSVLRSSLILFFCFFYYSIVP